MINKLYHWTVFYKIWPHYPDQFNRQIIPILFFNTSVNILQYVRSEDVSKYHNEMIRCM